MSSAGLDRFACFFLRIMAYVGYWWVLESASIIVCAGGSLLVLGRVPSHVRFAWCLTSLATLAVGHVGGWELTELDLPASGAGASQRQSPPKKGGRQQGTDGD